MFDPLVYPWEVQGPADCPFGKLYSCFWAHQVHKTLGSVRNPEFSPLSLSSHHLLGGALTPDGSQKRLPMATPIPLVPGLGCDFLLFSGFLPRQGLIPFSSCMKPRERQAEGPPHCLVSHHPPPSVLKRRCNKGRDKSLPKMIVSNTQQCSVHMLKKWMSEKNQQPRGMIVKEIIEFLWAIAVSICIYIY